MITSCPRETRSVPSVSGASIACPPGLSVIESTSIPRVGRELARQLQHLAAAVGRDQPAARDELGGDDERAGLRELFAERVTCGRIAGISLPDLSSPHGRPAGARRRDGPDRWRRSATRSSRARPASARRSTSTRCWRGWTRARARPCSPRSRRSPAGRSHERVGTPEFLHVRALAIEAFYSDFVAPGVDADRRLGGDRLQHAARDAAREGLVVPRHRDERALRRRRRRLGRRRRSRGRRARGPRPERAAARARAAQDRGRLHALGGEGRRTTSGGRSGSR